MSTAKDWLHRNLSLIILILIVLMLAVAYTTWAVDVSQHHWCAMLNLLATAKPPRGSVSTSPYAHHLYSDFQQLRASLGCTG